MTVTTRYEALHYPGDVTRARQAQPGALLGSDEMGRPYEVIDAEYLPDGDRTLVLLQYASTDTLRALLAPYTPARPSTPPRTPGRRR